jgi:23S rRNA (uracil1939-C5)-methyltransferase
VRSCLIENEHAGEIIRTLASLAGRFRLSIHNEYTHRGWLRHFVIRVGAQTGEVMVTLVAVSEQFPQAKAFTEALLAAHPDITTVVLNVNPRRTSMVLGRRDIPLYGQGWIEDRLCGRTFRISPQSFYQVNARQTEILYRTAIDLAGLTGEETLLDAYCGTGTIGLCAADRVRTLIGVELNREAVEDAKINAARNGVENASFYCGDAGQFMTRMAREGRSVDAVVMDPPRTGSDEAFLSSVLTLAPSRIVYVSCNPETLARDAAYLVRGGYRCARAVPVDMFPCTEHVETVCCLYHQKKDFISVPYEPKDANHLRQMK